MQGMLLVFRRADSPYRTADVVLRGLQPDARYEVVSDLSGPLGVVIGTELARSFPIHLPDRHRSDLIVYKRKSD